MVTAAVCRWCAAGVPQVVGKVVEVGEGTTSLLVGDRAVFTMYACGECWCGCTYSCGGYYHGYYYTPEKYFPGRRWRQPWCGWF